MNESSNLNNDTTRDPEETAFSLVELLIVFAKHKKLIVVLPVMTFIAAFGLSFALPNIYKATTKLLPPQQAQSGASALLSQLGGVAGAGAAVLKNPNDLYVGMLQSRTIAEKLVGQYDLKKVYETDSMEKARRNLADSTLIVAGKDGLITIEVEDVNQKRAALLANAYVTELLKLTKVLAVTEAAQRRVFFERQLATSKDNLANAEAKLKYALDTRGVISVDSDSRAIVETVGRLRAQVSAKEIELSSMQAFVTTSNQAYKRAQEELTSLKSELFKLENGRSAAPGKDAVADDQLPGLENIKILRDVKYHQMLYELLSKQYEAARLDEAKDTSLIQVLDSAVEPELKFKPKRTFLAITAALLAMFGAMAWALIAEKKAAAMENPLTKARWMVFKDALKKR